MAQQQEPDAPGIVEAGWQGITVRIPQDWNIGAISGDATAGYVRWDDDDMPRLEVKWASEKGFVDLNAVIDKYLRDIQKGRKKQAPEIEITRDVKLTGRGKRKKSGAKCFHWKAELEGYGAAWVCKDCGRTVIAQLMMPPGQTGAQAEAFAGAVLMGIDDHPNGGWTLWSAYGLDVRVPEEFSLSGQKLMAGLIELEFAKETEQIKVARWGMASVALKRKSLKDWVGSQLGKELRKHGATGDEGTVKGHEGLLLEGSNVGGVQLLQRFIAHCREQLYADRLIARAWHCEPMNDIYYVQTFVDRKNVELVDEIVARIQCHPGVGDDTAQCSGD